MLALERLRGLVVIGEVQRRPDLFPVLRSSARLLSREVATSMRGRAVEAVVYPFSFREHLRHHRREPDKTPGRLTKAQRSSLEKDLSGDLVAGGFPEAQGLNMRDRNELLRDAGTGPARR